MTDIARNADRHRRAYGFIDAGAVACTLSIWLQVADENLPAIPETTPRHQQLGQFENLRVGGR